MPVILPAQDHEAWLGEIDDPTRRGTVRLAGAQRPLAADFYSPLLIILNPDYGSG
jgi:hypothetical protein